MILTWRRTEASLNPGREETAYRGQTGGDTHVQSRHTLQQRREGLDAEGKTQVDSEPEHQIRLELDKINNEGNSRNNRISEDRKQIPLNTSEINIMRHIILKKLNKLT